MRRARLEWKDAKEKPSESGYYLIIGPKGSMELTTTHPSWWNWKHKDRSKAEHFDGPKVKRWAFVAPLHVTLEQRAAARASQRRSGAL